MPRVDNEIKLDFKDVLIRPKRSTLKSRADVDISRQYIYRHSKRQFPTDTIPIIAANMDTVGTFEMAVVLSQYKVITCIHKHYTLEEWIAFKTKHPEVIPYIICAAGMNEADEEKLALILNAIPEINAICLDVANGYSQYFINYVKRVRGKFQEHILIAGNVVTGEMVEQLLLDGADIIKVGIGPGSVCTTRMKTGVGYPQVSAVLECADAAHGLGGHIVSDGGCTCPGDIAKAFGAGADYVMLGGMLAGHDESGGELVERDGKKMKIFYGMSSETAMKKHAGGVADYRASEGKTVEIAYRGKVEGTISDILGGIRSACTYVGASKLKELSKRTTFIRVTQQLNQVFK